MADHSSSLKSIRQTRVRAQRNQSRMSRIRTTIRQVEEAIVSGDKPNAQQAFGVMQSQIMRGVQRNLMHLNTAARKISRASARIKAL